MIEDFAIPNEVWEAALTVSNYAKMQGWSGNWCIADVCSRETIDNLNKEIKQWKANHDNQVKLKSILIQRPDLKDRARDYCANCGEEIPQNAHQAEIARLRKAIEDIDDITGFDWPTMPEPIKENIHKQLREIVLTALARPNDSSSATAEQQKD